MRGLRFAFLSCFFALVLWALNAASAASTDEDADLILHSGSIYTPDGMVEAMAIHQGVILDVGPDDAILKLRTSETTLIDLAGRTAVPGIHDMHVHGLFAGLEQTQCGFPQAAAPEAIRDRVAVCVKAAQPGDWVAGGNWVAAVFKPGEQTKAFLDAVSPNNPVILSDESHHSIWVNSLALEAAGINRDTLNPPGGIIERDASGEATGLLRETATNLVESIIPRPSEAARRAALELSTGQMLSFGITTFLDASIREENIAVYGALAREGIIKQRVRGCIVWETSSNSWRAGGYELAERLIAERHLHEGGRYKLDCIKLFLDGVPTESKTGAMLAPYLSTNGHGHAHGPHASDERGLLMIDDDLLNKAVARFDRQGLNVKFHAAGDRAVRQALNAVEYARSVNGWGGPQHHVAHSTFVDSMDIPRGRDLRMAWEFSPYIWYPTPIASVDIMKVVGEERMQRWVPIRDAVESDALVVAGSDWSIVPSVNPWLALETMVTREIPGGSDENLGLGQAVDLETAFRIMTENGATLMGHRDRVGSLEVGMLADIAVLQKDPFQIPIRSLHDMQVDMTIIEGEVVYERQ